jgi:hypothetical protein
MSWKSPKNERSRKTAYAAMTFSALSAEASRSIQRRSVRRRLADDSQTDFCSYKLKTTKDQTFCRNENNVSGFCSKQACPLANSRYATIRSDPKTGHLYLYIKAIERAHLPSRWWEKIRLPSNYTKALEMVDSHLAYFPKFIVHKNKQRLTRLTQVVSNVWMTVCLQMKMLTRHRTSAFASWLRKMSA